MLLLILEQVNHFGCLFPHLENEDKNNSMLNKKVCVCVRVHVCVNEPFAESSAHNNHFRNDYYGLWNLTNMKLNTHSDSSSNQLTGSIFLCVCLSLLKARIYTHMHTHTPLLFYDIKRNNITTLKEFIL